MKGYAVAYRIGITPWERYPGAAAASIAALLDREEVDRSHSLGRALDLGCGRGIYTSELARRGWEAVGVAYVPEAINAARGRAAAGTRFVVGEVTDLPSAGLGTFEFFLDVGCFQGLNSTQRLATGRGVTALAASSATLLMLASSAARLAQSWVACRGRTSRRRFRDGTSSRSTRARRRGWAGR